MSKTLKFNKLKCSPQMSLKLTKRLSKFTCYDKQHLNILKQEWNNKHPNNKIKSKDEYQIWNELRKNMSNNCKNERCWLDQEFITDKITCKNHENIFSPKMPEKWKRNIYEWLNSNDIIKIMKQYESAYKFFKFIGPSPMDFDKKLYDGKCVWNDLCVFSIKNMINKNKRKIGIILNLDTHDLEGSHWVCLFIDLDKKFIFYFDSNGDKPPHEIGIFVQRVTKEYEELYKKTLKYSDNRDIEHQYKDGTCGIYSIYVVIELLLGKKTPEYIKRHRITDKLMTNYRFIYFNKD